MIGAEAAHERGGYVKDAVFRCDQTFGADENAIYLCHGTTDSCMALATGNIRSLFSWLEATSSPWGRITQERALTTGREEPSR